MLFNIRQSILSTNKKIKFECLIPKAFSILKFHKLNYTEVKRNKQDDLGVDNLKLIRDRIKLVDIDEVGIDTVEHWTDQITYFLEKENFKRFEESIRYLRNKNVPLTVNEINKFLPHIYNKSAKSMDLLIDYINEKNIRPDSVSYHFLILSALKFKSFKEAYDLFVESSIFGITQNLTVVTCLLISLSKLPKHDWEKYKPMIENHYEKYYTKEDIE
jgi:hypothetical protein